MPLRETAEQHEPGEARQAVEVGHEAEGSEGRETVVTHMITNTLKKTNSGVVRVVARARHVQSGLGELVETALLSDGRTYRVIGPPYGDGKHTPGTEMDGVVQWLRGPREKRT